VPVFLGLVVAEDLHVFFGSGAQFVQPHGVPVFVLALGHLALEGLVGVVETAAVGQPAAHRLLPAPQLVGQHFARFHVHHFDHGVLVAPVSLAEGDELAVTAGRDAGEGLGLGPLVRVEQLDRFGAFVGTGHVDPLLVFLLLGVIEQAVTLEHSPGHAFVVVSPQLVEAAGQPDLLGQVVDDARRIGGLGLGPGDNLGVLGVLEPGVVVGQGGAVEVLTHRDLVRFRGRSDRCDLVGRFGLAAGHEAQGCQQDKTCQDRSSGHGKLLEKKDNEGRDQGRSLEVRHQRINGIGVISEGLWPVSGGGRGCRPRHDGPARSSGRRRAGNIRRASGPR